MKTFIEFSSKYTSQHENAIEYFFNRNHQVRKDIRNCFANFNFKGQNSLINLPSCIKIKF